MSSSFRIHIYESNHELELANKREDETVPTLVDSYDDDGNVAIYQIDLHDGKISPPVARWLLRKIHLQNDFKEEKAKYFPLEALTDFVNDTRRRQAAGEVVGEQQVRAKYFLVAALRYNEASSEYVFTELTHDDLALALYNRVSPEELKKFLSFCEGETPESAHLKVSNACFDALTEDIERLHIEGIDPDWMDANDIHKVELLSWTIDSDKPIENVAKLISHHLDISLRVVNERREGYFSDRLKDFFENMACSTSAGLYSLDEEDATVIIKGMIEDVLFHINPEKLDDSRKGLFDEIADMCGYDATPDKAASLTFLSREDVLDYLQERYYGHGIEPALRHAEIIFEQSDSAPVNVPPEMSAQQWAKAYATLLNQAVGYYLQPDGYCISYYKKELVQELRALLATKGKAFLEENLNVAEILYDELAIKALTNAQFAADEDLERFFNELEIPDSVIQTVAVARLTEFLSEDDGIHPSREQFCITGIKPFLTPEMIAHTVIKSLQAEQQREHSTGVHLAHQIAYIVTRKDLDPQYAVAVLEALTRENVSRELKESFLGACFHKLEYARYQEGVDRETGYKELPPELQEAIALFIYDPDHPIAPSASIVGEEASIKGAARIVENRLAAIGAEQTPATSRAIEAILADPSSRRAVISLDHTLKGAGRSR